MIASRGECFFAQRRYVTLWHLSNMQATPEEPAAKMHMRPVRQKRPRQRPAGSLGVTAGVCCVILLLAIIAYAWMRLDRHSMRVMQMEEALGVAHREDHRFLRSLRERYAIEASNMEEACRQMYAHVNDTYRELGIRRSIPAVGPLLMTEYRGVVAFCKSMQKRQVPDVVWPYVLMAFQQQRRSPLEWKL